MKFYGIALAAVPRKDNPDIIDVTCNTIAVAHKNRDHIEPIKEPLPPGKEPLSFETSFDATDTKQVMAAFTRLVSTIGEVTKLQKESCKECSQYWPVALDFGEDARKPLDMNHWASPANIITTQLFGKRLRAALTPRTLTEQLINQAFSSEFANEPWEEKIVLFARASKKVADDHERIATAFFGDLEQEGKVLHAHSSREAALKENAECLDAFFSACKKLPSLLKDCHLEFGSFSTAGINKPVNSSLAKQLREIKKTMKDGKPDAATLKILITLARKEGVTHARLNDEHEGGQVFQWPAPPGYLENPEMRAQYPQYEFFDWHPAIRTAFYESYYKTKQGTANASFSLPTDSSMPPFVTPCADMIRNMLDAAYGLIHPDSPDHPDWRERLSSLSSETAETGIRKR